MPDPQIHTNETVPSTTPDNTRITIYQYDKTYLDKKVIDDLSLLAVLPQEPMITWLDVMAPCTPALLSKIFSALHIPTSDVLLSLSMTDGPHFTYSLDQIFQFNRIVCYDATFSQCQASFFLGKNFLLSFHTEPIETWTEIAAQLNNSESILRAASADYLLYTQLLCLTNTHLKKLHQLGSEVDNIEAFLIINPQNFSMDTFFALRKAFVIFRRTLWLHRDLYMQAAELGPQLPKQLASGLNHLSAKISDLLDLCDNYIDHCHALLDIYYSSLSTQTNRVMKTLTVFSVIFLPLSFLAGLWGMNFHNPKSPWAMPELSFYYGYPLALLLMLTIGGGLLTIFIKIGWLKFGKKRT